MSPLPLGILASAGAVAGPAYELIATVIPTTSDITFSNIPQGYKHLEVRYVIRSTNAVFRQDMTFRPNGESTTRQGHELVATGTLIRTINRVPSGALFARIFPGSTTANVFAPGIIQILDYTSTGKLKTVRALTSDNDSGSANVPNVGLRSGYTATTSAITSLEMGWTGSAATGSRISLYGIRG